MGSRSHGPGDRTRPDDRRRGQSDLLGFVFVFAIVVTTVALVGVVGYAQLDGVRDVERQNGAQRAVQALDDNVDDLVYDGAPARSTEMRLSEASLYVGDPVTINVTGERVGDPSRNFSHRFRIRPVVRESRSGGTVVYLTGAVVREEADGAPVMVRDPTLSVGAERTLLPVVRPVQERDRRVSGTNTVLVGTTRTGGAVSADARRP